MKYIKEYLEEELHITTDKTITLDPLEHQEIGIYGYSVLLDNKYIGVEIWYSDYCDWLDEKIKKK